MKSISILLSLLLLSLLPADAQWRSANLSIASTVQDIGNINEADGAAVHEFGISNTGETPLIINRISANCTCIRIDWPKEPILPGAEGIVSVTLDPTGRPGPFSYNLTIFSNAAESGHVVSFRGNVVPRPRTPDEVYRRRIGDIGFVNTNVSLGRIFRHESKTDTLLLYNFSDEPVTLNFDRIPSHITITPKPEVLEPAQEGLIIVSFYAEQKDEWGFTVDRVRLLPNNKNAQNNQLSISASIEEDFSKLTDKERELAPRITFTETHKDFGELTEGVTVEHEFVFTNTGKSDLIIRRIRASCGCTTVAPSVSVIKPGESSSLKASFRTQGFRGRQSKSITVTTNDPASSSAVIRLSATVNPKAE